MAANEARSLQPPKARWTLESGLPQVIYSALFAAVIVLASVSIYYDFFPSPGPRESTPTFSVDNVTLSFAGPSASNLTSTASWCPRWWEGTYAVAGPLRIDVGVGLVPTAASCSHLGGTVLYEVDTPSTGKFQIENVSWNGASLPGSGYLPGSGAHLPYGNSSVCDSEVELLITLGYTPRAQSTKRSPSP